MELLRCTASMGSAIATKEDIHLDALVIAHCEKSRSAVTRSTPVSQLHIDLPFMKFKLKDSWVWANSAWELPPEAKLDSSHIVKRRDAGDIFWMQKNLNLSSGPEKNYLINHQIILTPTVSWIFAERGNGKASRSMVRRWVKGIKNIGRYRKMGYGQVIKWTFEKIFIDPMSILYSAGMLRRNIPAHWAKSGEGQDTGAVTPPYWHPGLFEPRYRAGRRVALCDGIEIKC